jgi:hypothetical protein
VDKTALILENSDKDLATWISDLRDPARSKAAIEELMNLQTDKEEIKGLKLFLMQNNGDTESLWIFFDRNKNKTFEKKQWQFKSFAQIGIAASVIVLVGLAISFLIKDESIIAKYGVYDPGLPVLMSSANSHEMGNWMQEYKAGNFEQALEKGNELLIKEPENDTILYYQGVIHMQLTHIESAVELFEILKENTHSTYLIPAQYNLSLCYLSLDRKPKATSLLRKVAASSDEEYAAQAKLLLTEELQK